SISQSDNVRITIINLDGTVLFESDTTQPLDNHLQRAEIQSALNGVPTITTRRSATLNSKMLYYAIKSFDGNYVIRLSVNSTDISQVFMPSLPYIIASFALALALSFILATLLSKYFTSKLANVRESLRSLNKGNYQPLTATMREPELFSIFNEMDAMFKNTERYIHVQQVGQAKLDFILNNLKQGIITLDSRKKIVQINAFATSLFETNNGVVGKNLIYLISDQDIYNKIVNAINSDIDGIFEYHLQDKYLVFSVRKVDDSDLDGDIAYIILIADVSSEKLFVEQKSDFFANASHELKTPLTSMQGLSELLASKSDLDPQSKKYAERIASESKRLNSLILDMLKLSKLEKHEDEPAPKQIDLQEVCASVVSDLSALADKNAIITNITGSGFVFADQKTLYELVSNIYSNAINYNIEGGKIDISIANAPTDKLTLSIKDTGIGIPKEDMPRLCERFFRVNKSRSKKSGGTGLGLAIVKHICVNL
ncbi:MAG: ATP-binding protein, partial [Clostridia bacterium]